MISALMVLFYLLFPALIIKLCARWKLAGQIGPVLLCYLGGIAFGNIGILPKGVSGFQDTLGSAFVALGISMMLMTFDVGEWKATAGKAILSFALACVAIIFVAWLGLRIFGNSIPEAWKVAGMAIGVYTGGTPNMAAIRTALGTSSDTFILMNTYDALLSFLYIVFCATLAQRVFGLILPAFRLPAGTGSGNGELSASPSGKETAEGVGDYRGIFAPRVMLPLARNFLLALAIAGLSIGLSGLVPKDWSTALAILSITTLSIALSFIPKIRATPKGFPAGMYLIYAFSTVIASMVDFSAFSSVNWPMLGFVTLCVFGGMTVHGLLCAIFRIDVDTFILTSVSAICSPPFVPVVASAIRNRHLLLAAITTGIIGYAVGNYLGIGFAFLVRG
ncbi:MAG: DUF819 family protein [Spirochaetota bacterium]